MKKATRTSLTERAMEALTNAVAKIVEDHRRRAKPLAVWRDGKAVLILPRKPVRCTKRGSLPGQAEPPRKATESHRSR